jgi:hypothetical protein
MAFEKLRVGTRLREKATGNLYWIELVENGGENGYAYTLEPEPTEKVSSVHIGGSEQLPYEVFIETT